jgi:poly-gamma-glutamate synthesis protein (capsule biosynthesis protein)
LPPITIGFAGDTSFTHGLADRDPLGDIAAELSAPDLMIVNLETTVAESDVGKAIDKTYTFKSPPESGKLLAAAGVDVAALANNHAIDFGPDAVLRTIEILDAAGVGTVGTGATSEAAYAALHVDVSGWDIAILSFSRVPCDSPEPGERFIDEVAWACPEFEAETVAAVEAAADADYTIVMVHWGVQREVCPAAHQPDLAAQWIAAGADAVVGSHPHVLQGVEKIDGAWVVHSTGNFAFPSARDSSSYSAIFAMTVSADDVELEATPVRILDGRPVPAIASRAGILNDLTRRSFGFSFEDNGRASPTEAPSKC